VPIGYHDENDQFQPVPHRWAICAHCDGEGLSSSHLGDVTNWLRESEPEEIEDYFDGAYDRPCDFCDGAGKVMVADFTKMTPEQAAAFRIEQQVIRDMRREEEAERLFGC